MRNRELGRGKAETRDGHAEGETRRRISRDRDSVSQTDLGKYIQDNVEYRVSGLTRAFHIQIFVGIRRK